MFHMLLWRLAHWFYSIGHNPIPNVNVGILTAHRLRNWDGTARVRVGEHYEDLQFIVDNHRFLFYPSRAVVARIFAQLQQMGYDVARITVKHTHDRERRFSYSAYQRFIPHGRQAAVRLKYRAF